MVRVGVESRVRVRANAITVSDRLTPSFSHLANLQPPFAPENRATVLPPFYNILIAMS
jgi:hypothetical protein